MLFKLLIAFLLMAVCVMVHAIALTSAFRYVEARAISLGGESWRGTWLLSRIAAWTILSHLLQIVIWGFVYAAFDAIHGLTNAVYFSAVTYTTTGYGDLTLPEEWRIVGGIEALTGILMCGLSTGLFFGVFARIAGLLGPRSPAQ